jgi:hypothetical protein
MAKKKDTENTKKKTVKIGAKKPIAKKPKKNNKPKIKTSNDAKNFVRETYIRMGLINKGEKSKSKMIEDSKGNKLCNF